METIMGSLGLSNLWRIVEYFLTGMTPTVSMNLLTNTGTMAVQLVEGIARYGMAPVMNQLNMGALFQAPTAAELYLGTTLP
jgi:hypothetical protein